MDLSWISIMPLKFFKPLSLALALVMDSRLAPIEVAMN